ncbi:MAG: DNA recombination/repair protein RecA, partial [Candidatus Omnitrophica bacterium]|nr:DNA recombination/repair protein RecA [Candidatus Omnitrophota bacterium]
MEKKAVAKGESEAAAEKKEAHHETTEKLKALELAVSQIEKQFGKGSIMRLGG